MRTYFLILFFFSVNICTAQTKFAPTVIVLYPNEVKTDSLAGSELMVYQKPGVVTEQLRKEFLREGLAPNWKTIRERELLFMDDQNFFSMLILSLTRELTYREIENRSNLLIYPVKQTTPGALPAYKKIADQHKISWVVNVTQSECFMEGEKRVLRVSIQLYNGVTNRLYIDKAYSVDTATLQPSETCNEAWLCLAESIQQLVVHDLADRIEKNIRHER